MAKQKRPQVPRPPRVWRVAITGGILFCLLLVLAWTVYANMVRAPEAATQEGAGLDSLAPSPSQGEITPPTFSQPVKTAKPSAPPKTTEELKKEMLATLFRGGVGDSRFMSVSQAPFEKPGFYEVIFTQMPDSFFLDRLKEKGVEFIYAHQPLAHQYHVPTAEGYALFDGFPVDSVCLVSIDEIPPAQKAQSAK